MTAPDPRVGEIEARETLVHVKCADCAKCRVAEEECWCVECEYWGCERGPDCEDDPNPTDVAYLLAELRKAHEALAAVEEFADWACYYSPGHLVSRSVRDPDYRQQDPYEDEEGRALVQAIHDRKNERHDDV